MQRKYFQAEFTGPTTLVLFFVSQKKNSGDHPEILKLISVTRKMIACKF